MKPPSIIRIAGIVGVLCLAGSLLLDQVRYPNTTVTTGTALAGATLLLLFAVVYRRDLLSVFLAMIRGRSARQGANAVLMTVFFTAILTMIQAISVQNRVIFDVTSNSRFTLAPQTIDLLRSLDADLNVRAFYRSTSPNRPEARDLLERYARYSEHFRYEFVDPDRNPTLADEMGARYDDVVVSAGSRRRTASRVTEDGLTNAMLQVTLDRFKTVYFVTGHNEKNIDDRDRGGYSVVRQSLSGQGYQVRALSLVDVDRIPEDCEVLIVAGPRVRYLQSEIDHIDLYLRRGRNAMFLIDPRQDLPGIETLLAGYHVYLDPVVLLDELVLVDAGERVFDATVTKVRRYERHEITRNFNLITMYPMARPVRLSEDTSSVWTIKGSYLAVTGESSWGEVDMESFKVGQATRDEDDYSPPLPVAAVVTRTPAVITRAEPLESRIVVFGDSDFANNTFYGLLGNADFFLNSLSYLAGDEKLINIRPHEGLRDQVFITASQSRLIFALSLVLLPLSVVVVGSNVLIRRRRDATRA